MEHINLESVPDFVQFYPRDQSTLDYEVAQAEAKFAKPAFGLTLGPYFAAIAARKASAMPLSVELWLISRHDSQGGYQTRTFDRNQAPAMPGPAPRAVAPKVMSRADAARHLTKAEFAEWDAAQRREAQA